MSTHDYSAKEVAQRLKESLRAHGIRQTELATEFGITPSTLSGHLDGKKYISPELAARLADKFKYNVEFLVAGKGRLLGSEEIDCILELEKNICQLLAGDGYETGPICMSDLADGIGFDYFKIRVDFRNASGKKQEIFDMRYDEKADPGSRIVFLFLDDKTDEQFEVPFGNLLLKDAVGFYDYLRQLLAENKKMERMGEMAYRFQGNSKRKDDVQLISFKRTSDGLIVFSLADELYDEKKMLDFVGKLMAQEFSSGCGVEACSAMQFLFACVSAVFACHSDKVVDYDGLVKSTGECMKNMRESFNEKMSKMFFK